MGGMFAQLDGQLTLKTCLVSKNLIAQETRKRNVSFVVFMNT